MADKQAAKLQKRRTSKSETRTDSEDEVVLWTSSSTTERSTRIEPEKAAQLPRKCLVVRRSEPKKGVTKTEIRLVVYNETKDKKRKMEYPALMDATEMLADRLRDLETKETKEEYDQELATRRMLEGVPRTAPMDEKKARQMLRKAAPSMYNHSSSTTDVSTATPMIQKRDSSSPLGSIRVSPKKSRAPDLKVSSQTSVTKTSTTKTESSSCGESDCCKQTPCSKQKSSSASSKSSASRGERRQRTKSSHKNRMRRIKSKRRSKGKSPVAKPGKQVPPPPPPAVKVDDSKKKLPEVKTRTNVKVTTKITCDERNCCMQQPCVKEKGRTKEGYTNTCDCGKPREELQRLKKSTRLEKKTTLPCSESKCCMQQPCVKEKAAAAAAARKTRDTTISEETEEWTEPASRGLSPTRASFGRGAISFSEQTFSCHSSEVTDSLDVLKRVLEKLRKSKTLKASGNVNAKAMEKTVTDFIDVLESKLNKNEKLSPKDIQNIKGIHSKVAELRRSGMLALTTTVTITESVSCDDDDSTY